MEIKIKLPHNVRITCPTPETAIIILRSLHFRSEYSDLVGRIESMRSQPPSANVEEISFPNSEHARTSWGPPAVSSRPFEGEGFMAGIGQYENTEAPFSPTVRSPHDEQIEDVDDEDIEISSEMFESEIERNEETKRRLETFNDFDDTEFNSIPEQENSYSENTNISIIDNEESSLGSLQSDEDEDDLGKANTRSMHSARLEIDDVEEESFNPIFLPVDPKFGERTQKVFDFIQTRLVFSMKDVAKFAKEELGLKNSKKNKKKLKTSLKVIEKTGLIQKTSKNEWRKVS